MIIYIRAQLCTSTAVVASKECTSTAVVASKEEREFLGANSEKISPPSASEVQTKIIIILNVNANKYCRVFAKVRFSKCTSLKIVPKAAFAVHF